MNKFIYGHFDAFYLIGIGGVSMSAIAKFLKNMGKRVAGSDIAESIYTCELKNGGVRIETGNEKSSLNEYEVIIYTDAIKESDSRLIEAKKLNKIIVSRGIFLAEMCSAFEKTVAISGCHGKTTVTSMIAHIFKCANKKFCAHIGGRDNEFSNFYYCGEDYFVTEACEYKKNFLFLRPDIGVILNTEPDHLECYGSEKNLISAYGEFCEKSTRSISLYGDRVTGQITFGLNGNADYYADNLDCVGNCYQFDAYETGKFLGRVFLNVFGKHNVLNALASIAVARAENISFDAISSGLSDFSGVERRMEFLGVYNGVKCYADYAHHPSEIKSALSSCGDTVNLFVIFQPHTYSRTKNLFSQFVEVLAAIENLMIFRTFAAREYFDDGGSALTLSNAVTSSVYGETCEDIKIFLKRATKNDMILFLGAGDIYDIAKNLIKNS